MKKLPGNLNIALITFTSLVLISACATLPKQKPGLYVNNEFRFTVKYSKELTKIPEESQLFSMSPGTVLFAQSQGGVYSSIRVVVRDAKGMKDLADVESLPDLPDSFMEMLKTRYRSNNVKLLYKKEKKLLDGTPAIEFVIRWTYRNSMTFDSMILGVLKKDKVIRVGLSVMKDVMGEDHKKFVRSLKFYPQD